MPQKETKSAVETLTNLHTAGTQNIRRWAETLSTSDFQSEVGEVFGEIGGELPANFGRRFSSFFCWGKLSEASTTKTPPQISPSNFTTSFWVVAGPTNMVSGVRFQTPCSVSFLPSPSSGCEFLSAYYLCATAKANSPSFSQSSPSLPQNSVRLSEFSSPNSTLYQQWQLGLWKTRPATDPKRENN